MMGTANLKTPNSLVSRSGLSEITGFVPLYATKRSDGNDQSHGFSGKTIPGQPGKSIDDLLGITIHGPGKNDTFRFVEPEGMPL